MEQIRLGREDGLDVSLYADPRFDYAQMEQIRLGFESRVDVSQYADPRFDYRQMEEIRKGLEDGVDVSQYADPKLDAKQMERIREAIKSGLPSDYNEMSKSEKAKARWSRVKQAAASRQPLDIPALEEEFDLGTLEGRAAYTLGLAFDENTDGSIVFSTTAGEIGTLSSKEFDNLVRDAIANSSTRSAFTKAFAVRLKRALDLA